MLLLVDLDGTVWRGRTAVPGIPELLTERAAAGDVIVYVTNNSTRHRADYLPRLAAVGAPADISLVVTSARATAVHVAALEPQVDRVLAVGTPGLVAELREVGLTVVPAGEAVEAATEGSFRVEAAGDPQAVVVGLDRGFDYARLAIASACIRAGALFFATNRDPVFPTEYGFVPGAGSIVAAVEVASGVEPISIGKPGPLLLQVAADAAGVPLDGAVVIGDSLQTDIPAAHAAGVDSVLLLTGVTAPEHLEDLPASQHPTAVARDADELRVALRRLAR
jgi:phosphoglycolate/pyridoxal phosphate phosphatase family enzyme